jgi:hypothetical protein
MMANVEVKREREASTEAAELLGMDHICKNTLRDVLPGNQWSTCNV